MDGLKIGDVQFKVGGKPHKFSVINNLPGTFGLSLEGAVDNWLARTDDYSADSFCKYVTSKDSSIICCKPTLENKTKYKLK